MVGLNRWCQKQGVDPELCNALFKGNLCRDDVERLKTIKQKTPEDFLSKKEANIHRLWDLKVHTNKDKEGKVKIFWPPSTPTAQTMTGVRGGKAMGKPSSRKEHPKKKDEENTAAYWSGGGPKAKFCTQCRQSEYFVEGKCVICCPDPSDPGQDSPMAEEEKPMGVQPDQAKAEVRSKDFDATAKLTRLESKLATTEKFLATLHHLQRDDVLVVQCQAEVQTIKVAITAAQSEVQQVPAAEDADLKAARSASKESIKAAKLLEPQKGEEFSPVVKILEERLAKLQPKPKEKSIFNQLRNVQAALTSKQDDREKIVKAKAKVQEQIEGLQQTVAKLDRRTAVVDTELVDLSKQAAILLEECKAQNPSSNQQAQTGVRLEVLSEADAQKMIAVFELTATPEQLMAKWNQANATDQQSPQSVQPQPQVQAAAPAEAPAPTPSASPHGGARVASHRGSETQPPIRRKPKDIPATSIDQKAAVLRSATGAVRDELFRVARDNAVREDDSNDVSEGEESAAAVDEELAAAQDWKGA